MNLRNPDPYHRKPLREKDAWYDSEGNKHHRWTKKNIPILLGFIGLSLLLLLIGFLRSGRS